MLTPEDWHARFSTQASWTETVRRYLTADINLDPAANILDVGCGTGVLFPFFNEIFPAADLFGLDLNPDFLRLAASHSQAALIEGDAYQLPFATGTFAMVYCHYFLLWLTGKEFVLKEIFRILQPGGVFLVLAEPDHFGRIDYPEKLAELGRLQTQALTAQGIDPAAGRKVAALLHQAGFDQVMTGVIGSEWRQQPDLKQLASEWRILRYDLRDRLSAEQLAQLQHLDEQAWEAGMRILYVPTFFARANKPVGRTNPAY